MSVFAVGDLQGCLQPLLDLLGQVEFDAAHDTLWLVGDLINRGPESVETLRFVKSLGPAAKAVLGNHDLFFLAVAAGAKTRQSSLDTIDPIFAAPDAAELIDWLRAQPLMHVEDGFAMVHAGLLPQWTVPQAQALAEEVSVQLRSPGWREYLQQLFGNKPDAWQDALTGWDRHRVVINAMTRMRYMSPEGRIDLKAKGPLESAPPGLIPWFSAAQPAWASHTVVCGHWSALGFRDMGGVIALDSGCVWGRCLTACRLADRRIFRAQCAQLGTAAQEGGD